MSHLSHSPSHWSVAVAAVLLLLAGCGREEQRKEYAQAPAAFPLIAEANAATPSTAANAPKMAPAPGTVRRDTDLKEKPFVDAKTLKRLPSGTKLTVVDRDAGWLRVSAGNQQGWVRLLHVSTQPAAAGSKDLESAKIATGRAGSGNVVATTGIRGLNEAQLSAAKPNPEELKKLDGYVVTKEQAADNARKHKLARRDVAYLPEPR